MLDLEVKIDDHADTLQLFFKRVFDILISSIVLTICSPLFFLIAILIKSGSRGPVIYKQERIGRGGEVFTLFKFRTMIKNAETDVPVWSSNKDPRITTLGMWLRTTNLDEFLQLVNIIKGDMSLVGPRPERPYFAEKFNNQYSDYSKRHSLKPGITGWAQIHGFYGDSSIEKRLEHDLYYLKNWSLLLDIKVLLKTSQRFIKNLVR